MSGAKVTLNEDGQILCLESLWSQRDLSRYEKTSSLRTHTINVTSGKVLSSSGPQEVKNEYVSVIIACFSWIVITFLFA